MGEKKMVGKNVVITGAAQGLGQALAIQLSKEGANVAIGDMNIEGAEATAQMCENAFAMQLDVTNNESCNALMKAAKDRFGGIDIVVSNAGILCSGSIDEFDPAKWKLVVDVNLAVFLTYPKRRCLI